MANFDGRGSEYRLEKEHECPNCQQRGHVYYLGSSVMHGNPYTPAADTEVDHHYRCTRCGHEFAVYT